MKKRFVAGFFLLSLASSMVFVSCHTTTDFGDGPLTVTGPDFKEIVRANETLSAFQKKYNLPGVSIAISYQNRLVYSASCGYADFENKIKLTPSSRMDIASLTKSITAAAIMKLMENHQLDLDEQVFGENSILGSSYGLPMFNGQPAKISVRNLLSHTAGGWPNSKDDPMFSQKMVGLTGKAFISTVLKNFPLENEPGIKFEYSNFGYYLLGRVIEARSGKSYEKYVKESIIGPLGISDMAIGTIDTAKDEVNYYAGGDMNAISPTHFDSSGGWMGTTVDLLMFLSGIDKFKNNKGLLSEQSIDLMTFPTHDNYGFGFYVNKKYDNWWHTGALSRGAASEMGRSNDGFCWAILVNYMPSPEKRKNFYADLDQLFWRIKTEVKNWPEGDLL